MPPLEILALGLGLAALICLIALLLAGRRASRSIHRLATGVERLGQEDPLTDPGPMQEGPEAARRLGRALERMRQRLASRMAALERDRATRDAILAALDEGIVLFDGSGSVLYANGSARRLLGTAVANAKQLVPTSLRGMVEAAAGGGRPSPAETALGADGRTIQATAVQVPDDRSVLLILRDTTQTRRVDAIRRDFVANASHELKTPVASIQALAQTIGSALDDRGTAARFAAQLEGEAGRLSRVIADLLDLSRLEAAERGGELVRLDLLVTDEAGRVRGRAAEAGLSVTVHADTPVVVSGAARDLSLMVRNLLENAVQYTKPGGHIQVSLAADHAVAVLEVRDDGIGIPAKDQPRIFERFYRVDRARSRETGGTGLGLAIVKHVAEAHDGTVRVAGELGQGSTFTVGLPLASVRDRGGSEHAAT